MRLEKLDLNLLVVLENLLQTHSVSQTANELYVSQPTISAALRRLREYFDDELFVQVGRNMVATPQCIALAPAVTESLDLVRYKIVKAGPFQPGISERRFRIAASDYVFDVLLAQALRDIHRIAPQLEFEIIPVTNETTQQFNKGHVDILITVREYVVAGHPSRLLFCDDDALIAWDQGVYASGVSVSQFETANFATVRFGADLQPSVGDIHLDQMGVQHKTNMQVTSFSALPAAVVGTDRLAILHGRHAKVFRDWYPVNVHPMPVQSHQTEEVIQWHRLRENDLGISWLLERLTAAADGLP